MKFYIPKQTKLTQERVEVKLEAGLIQTLERYCEYLDSDRDYVIGQALAIAFKKDKGFARWLNGQPGVVTHRSATLPPPDEAAPIPVLPQGDAKKRATGSVNALER